MKRAESRRAKVEVLDAYLTRLARRAEGCDPGPDPLVDGRVPTRAELGLA